MRGWCRVCDTRHGPPTRPRCRIDERSCDHGGMSAAVLAQDLRRVGLAAGLATIGFTSVEPFTEARAAIDARKAAGLDGGMQFTFRNSARSTEPERILAGARSLVVGAWRYDVDTPAPPPGDPTGRVAAYSWEDHYAELREALTALAAVCGPRGIAPVVLADQNHLVDRAAAQRAGIGWWGKSSNVLVPGVGSLVRPRFRRRPARRPCGAAGRRRLSLVRKCLDGCPTGAIIEPGVIDAALPRLAAAGRQLPGQHRVALGDRLYGCDDCQDVCPPNQIRRRRPTEVGRRWRWVPILDVLERSDDELMARRSVVHPRRDPASCGATSWWSWATSVTGGIPAWPRLRRRRSTMPSLVAHAVWAARRLGLDACSWSTTPRGGRRRRTQRPCPMSHLLVTNDFPPKVGGIQSYLWELWRRLPADDVVVHTTPYEGTDAFDAAQDFTIVRSREPWLLPHRLLTTAGE